MPISVEIDEALLERAKERTRIEEPRALVHQALELLIGQTPRPSSKPPSSPATSSPAPEKPNAPRESVPQFFGEYLVEQGLIDLSQLNDAVQLKKDTNLKIGDFSVRHGYLTTYQANQINQMQKRVDKYFGELAVERGLMTEDQVQDVLRMQREQRIRVGEALVKLKLVDYDIVEKHAKRFDELTEAQKAEADEGGEEDSGVGQVVIQYLSDSIPRLLTRLGDVHARIAQVEAMKPELKLEFDGSVKLVGGGTHYISVSLDIVFAHAILEGLFGNNFEEFFDTPPYEDAVAEFLGMLAANTTAHLEKLGFEVRADAPTVGEVRSEGQCVTIEVPMGEGRVIVGL